MKITSTALALATCIALAPSAANAAYTCDGYVTSLALNPSGLVTLSFGSLSNVYICSMSSVVNGVSPESCKAIFSHLLVAKITNKQERFQFSDAHEGNVAGRCTSAAHPSWSQLTGWYYGPVYL